MNSFEPPPIPPFTSHDALLVAGYCGAGCFLFLFAFGVAKSAHLLSWRAWIALVGAMLLPLGIHVGCLWRLIVESEGQPFNVYENYFDLIGHMFCILFMGPLLMVLFVKRIVPGAICLSAASGALAGMNINPYLTAVALSRGDWTGPFCQVALLVLIALLIVSGYLTWTAITGKRGREIAAGAFAVAANIFVIVTMMNYWPLWVGE
jgi:hypothetical protein